ncbi:NAD-dependent epimerase/dehydratase family protein [Rhodococcus sp. 105337]|nr:NAD-dependent epimerase/dehydratase family protein [Rhodococcus sp. 105337]
MRVLVLGGTTFIGRRIVERLHERGDRVLVVHRGHHEPSPWVAVDHLRVDRLALGDHADDVRRFDPDAVVDTYALTADHVDAVLPAIPEVPTVVLSSVDVYQAFTGLTSGALRIRGASDRGLRSAPGALSLPRGPEAGDPGRLRQARCRGAVAPARRRGVASSHGLRTARSAAPGGPGAAPDPRRTAAHPGRCRKSAVDPRPCR